MRFSIAARALGLALSSTLVSALFFAPPIGAQTNDDVPDVIIGPNGGTVAQDEADLQATRDLAYGRPLTAAQHDEITSWDVRDASWWRDAWLSESADYARFRAFERLLAMAGNAHFTVDEAELESRDETFGLRLFAEASIGAEKSVLGADGGGGGSEPGGGPAASEKTIVISGKLRPDVFYLSYTLESYVSLVLGEDLPTLLAVYHGEPAFTTLAGLAGDYAGDPRFSWVPGYEPGGAHLAEYDKLQHVVDRIETFLEAVAVHLYPDYGRLEGDLIAELVDARKLEESRIEQSLLDGDDFYAAYADARGRTIEGEYHEARARSLALLDALGDEAASSLLAYLGTRWVADGFKTSVAVQSAEDVRAEIIGLGQAMGRLVPGEPEPQDPPWIPPFLTATTFLEWRQQGAMRPEESQEVFLQQPTECDATPVVYDGEVGIIDWVGQASSQPRVEAEVRWGVRPALYYPVLSSIIAGGNFNWSARLEHAQDSAAGFCNEVNSAGCSYGFPPLCTISAQAPSCELTKPGRYNGTWKIDFVSDFPGSFVVEYTDSIQRTWEVSATASGGASTPVYNVQAEHTATAGQSVSNGVKINFTHNAASWQKSLTGQEYRNAVDLGCRVFDSAGQEVSCDCNDLDSCAPPELDCDDDDDETGGGDPTEPDTPIDEGPPECNFDSWTCDCLSENSSRPFWLCYYCSGAEPEDGHGLIVVCSELFPRLPYGSPKAACTDGASWFGCPDPALPLTERLPDHHFEDRFPPCHTTVDGVQVTPCTGDPNAADLVPLLVLPEQTRVQPGDEIALEVRIGNIGRRVAPNTRFRVRYQGSVTRTYDYWAGSLTPGDERSFQISSLDAGYLARSGVNSITVTVDSASELVEGREDNNVATASVQGESTLPTGVDLRVTRLEPELDYPVEGDTVRVDFRVQNFGDLASPATTVRAEITGPGLSARYETADVPPLSPGQSRGYSVEITSVMGGTHAVDAMVDPADEVDETSESNNDRSLLLDFAADTTCLPCTTGAPDNAVGDQLCFDPPASQPGPAWQGSLWECFGVRADGSTCVATGNHPNGWDHIGPRCPAPSTLAPGWHPDACGQPNVCPGRDTLP